MSAPESLVVEQVAIDRLRPDPSNPRQISPTALDDLTRSIQEFGNLQPFVAMPDGMVVGGHQRLIAVRRLGFTFPTVEM
jgi:ParB-like chromosome segregation protein Spo0J